MFQRKTLSKMNPKTKKLAITCNQAEQVYRNLKRQVEVVRELEFEELAFTNEQRFRNEVKAGENPDEKRWKDESAISKATGKIF